MDTFRFRTATYWEAMTLKTIIEHFKARFLSLKRRQCVGSMTKRCYQILWTDFDEVKCRWTWLDVSSWLFWFYFQNAHLTNGFCYISFLNRNFYSFIIKHFFFFLNHLTLKIIETSTVENDFLIDIYKTIYWDRLSVYNSMSFFHKNFISKNVICYFFP